MIIEHTRVSQFLTALAMVALLGLAACSVRPLYATGPTNSYVEEKLRSIRINPANDRINQRIRNELIFLFYGGSGEPDQWKYRLELTAKRSVIAVGIQPVSGTPTSRILALNARFILTDVETNKAVLIDGTSASASYDYSDQRLANLRAEKDAEDRAARTMAESVSTRIAAFLASNDDT